MQTYTTKYSAIEYAASMGWTKADARLAFEALPLPIDEIALLNIMVRFAGPVMLERQYAQRAQRGLATRREGEIEKLSNSFSVMVTDYEEQIQNDRSAFVPIVESLYKIAKPFGYRSAWIEALIATYRQYLDQNQPPKPQKKAA
jgi:hypothetical protein